MRRAARGRVKTELIHIRKTWISRGKFLRHSKAGTNTVAVRMGEEKTEWMVREGGHERYSSTAIIIITTRMCPSRTRGWKIYGVRTICGADSKNHPPHIIHNFSIYIFPGSPSRPIHFVRHHVHIRTNSFETPWRGRKRERVSEGESEVHKEPKSTARRSHSYFCDIYVPLARFIHTCASSCVVCIHAMCEGWCAILLRLFLFASFFGEWSVRTWRWRGWN